MLFEILTYNSTVLNYVSNFGDRTCILSGGSPYSYCGVHEHDVCCLVPENAEPVGILPAPKASRCGKKGKDTGKDGEAEMAEWPWHVRPLSTK